MKLIKLRENCWGIVQDGVIGDYDVVYDEGHSKYYVQNTSYENFAVSKETFKTKEDALKAFGANELTWRK